jgi:GntR family transcriptional regulator
MSNQSISRATKRQEEIVFAILNYIRSRRLQKGDRLPSQKEFAEQLEISRASLREALARLTSQGLIRQVHGIGTFVADDYSVVRSSAEINLSITEMIRNQGMEPGTSEIQLSVETIPFETNPKTGDELDRQVLCLRRVRTADGIPFTYSVAWLPLDIQGLALDEQAFEGSLYLFLQERCNEFVAEADSIIEARIADDEVSHKLGVPPQAPILVLNQQHFNKSHKLLIKSTEFFVQNRLQLRVKRFRPGASRFKGEEG